MCREQEVIDECKLKLAVCKEVNFGKGYECYCDKSFNMTFGMGSEVCKGMFFIYIYTLDLFSCWKKNM